MPENGNCNNDCIAVLYSRMDRRQGSNMMGCQSSGSDVLSSLSRMVEVELAPLDSLRAACSQDGPEHSNRMLEHVLAMHTLPAFPESAGNGSFEAR